MKKLLEWFQDHLGEQHNTKGKKKQINEKINEKMELATIDVDRTLSLKLGEEMWRLYTSETHCFPPLGKKTHFVREYIKSVVAKSSNTPGEFFGVGGKG